MPLFIPLAAWPPSSLSNTARHIAHWASAGSAVINKRSSIRKTFGFIVSGCKFLVSSFKLQVTGCRLQISGLSSILYPLSSILYSLFSILYSLIIRWNHQINNHPGNGNIQPKRIGDARNFSMLVKLSGNAPNIGYQHKWNNDYRQQYMR